MKTVDTLKLLLVSVFLLGFTSAFAQGSANDQADVWAVIENQWNADEKGDKKWPDKILADDFRGWPNSSPAPRDRSSTKMWDRFSDQNSKSLAHELYPLSIVVHDDVAVAHYLYTTATQSNGDEVETSNGRYTDVLVRTEDGWKFLAWHGGDD